MSGLGNCLSRTIVWFGKLPDHIDTMTHSPQGVYQHRSEHAGRVYPTARAHLWQRGSACFWKLTYCRRGVWLRVAMGQRLVRHCFRSCAVSAGRWCKRVLTGYDWAREFCYTHRNGRPNMICSSLSVCSGVNVESGYQLST